MPRRIVQRRPFVHTPLGDRREFIRIHTRSLTPPVFGSASFSESYLEKQIVYLSCIGTNAEGLTEEAHNLNVGDNVTIYGAAIPEYNGTFVITSIPNITEFTYTVVVPDLDSTTGFRNIDNSILTWAKVESVTLVGGGERLFDGVQMDISATHIFDIRYRPNITSENIIEYQHQYYRIIRVDDPEERHLSLIIHAALKGDQNLEVNK